jgi:hypothetical protein
VKNKLLLTTAVNTNDDGCYVRVVRPDRDEVTLCADPTHGAFIGMVLHVAQDDIDHGASGYIMVDKDFNQTGAPAPIPPGAYCLLCAKLITGHDGNTAFLLTLQFKQDEIGANCRGCCQKCSQLTDQQLMDRLMAKAKSGLPAARR